MELQADIIIDPVADVNFLATGYIQLLEEERPELVECIRPLITQYSEALVDQYADPATESIKYPKQGTLANPKAAAYELGLDQEFTEKELELMDSEHPRISVARRIRTNVAAERLERFMTSYGLVEFGSSGANQEVTTHPNQLASLLQAQKSENAITVRSLVDIDATKIAQIIVDGDQIRASFDRSQFDEKLIDKINPNFAGTGFGENLQLMRASESDGLPKSALLGTIDLCASFSPELADTTRAEYLNWHLFNSTDKGPAEIKQASNYLKSFLERVKLSFKPIHPQANLMQVLNSTKLTLDDINNKLTCVIAKLG